MSLRYASVLLIIGATINIYPYAMGRLGQGVTGPKVSKATGFDRCVGADMARPARGSGFDVSSLQAIAAQTSGMDAAELAYIKNCIGELTKKIDILFVLVESVASSMQHIEANIDLHGHQESITVSKKIDTQFDALALCAQANSSVEQIDNKLDVTTVALLKAILAHLNELLQLHVTKG